MDTFTIPTRGALRLLASILPFLIAAPASAQGDTVSNTRELVEHVGRNPLTADGYWLEMRNVLGHWEKVVLVFGFADPGDEAACEEIRAFAAEQNPNRAYRCNPVD